MAAAVTIARVGSNAGASVAAAPEPPDASAPLAADARPRRAPASPPRILLVDDDVDLLMVVAEALADEGYVVDTARNGADALKRVAAAAPELILLDMWMPVMDGWAFAKALRSRYGRTIPIIVVTAGQDSHTTAEEVGADTGLRKPFDLETLRRAVRAALAEPRHATSLTRKPGPADGR